MFLLVLGSKIARKIFNVDENANEYPLWHETCKSIPTTLSLIVFLFISSQIVQCKISKLFAIIRVNVKECPSTFILATAINNPDIICR